MHAQRSADVHRSLSRASESTDSVRLSTRDFERPIEEGLVHSHNHKQTKAVQQYINNMESFVGLA